jgi:hypothetical protein
LPFENLASPSSRSSAIAVTAQDGAVNRTNLRTVMILIAIIALVIVVIAILGLSAGAPQ